MSRSHEGHHHAIAAPEERTTEPRAPREAETLERAPDAHGATHGSAHASHDAHSAHRSHGWRAIRILRADVHMEAIKIVNGCAGFDKFFSTRNRLAKF